MSISTAVMIVGTVALVGYFLTAAYIVHRTGSTAGISVLARGTASILRALLGRGDAGDD